MQIVQRFFVSVFVDKLSRQSPVSDCLNFLGTGVDGEDAIEKLREQMRRDKNVARFADCYMESEPETADFGPNEITELFVFCGDGKCRRFVGNSAE